MHINWRKTTIIALDVILAGYIIIAITAFDRPNAEQRICTQVNINIEDEATNGFINATEIKKRLKKSKLYPLSKLMADINTRVIEETLEQSPFVKQAECYKTENGHVSISLTQRMPSLRIKAINGDD